MRTNSADIPIHIGWGWSTSYFNMICALIRFGTRPSISPFGRWAKWSHMFLVFQRADFSIVIHEALGSTGWREKPHDALLRWHADSPKNHLFEIHWLPIGQATITAIYRESREWLGTKSYDFQQIWAFTAGQSILFRLLKWQVVTTDDDVFCSEGASELVGKYALEWDLRTRRDLPWCLVTPQGAYDAYQRKVKDELSLPCGDT